MAKVGYLRAAIEELQQLITKPHAEVREDTTRGVGCLGCNNVKAAIERHQAKVCENHMASCLPCQNCTAKYPQTRWRGRGISSPPPEPAASSLGTPHAPAGDNDRNESYEIDGMPSRCVYIHSPLPNTQLFNHNAYAKDSTQDKEFISDLLSTLSAA
jgi:hypothetical protein